MKRFLLAIALALSLCVHAGCEEETKSPPTQPKPPTQVVYAFGATWCGPCIANKPALKRFEQRGLRVVHIDIDVRPDLKNQFGITNIPTYVVLRNGVEVERTHSVRRLSVYVAP